MEVEPSLVVVSLKVDDWAKPLEPAPIVVSTQGKRSAVHPLGFDEVALRGVAIHLLPHLVEAVDRAVVVGIVGMGRGSDLEWARRAESSRWECACRRRRG